MVTSQLTEKLENQVLESRKEPREAWQQENVARVTFQKCAAGMLPWVPAGPVFTLPPPLRSSSQLVFASFPGDPTPQAGAPD